MFEQDFLNPEHNLLLTLRQFESAGYISIDEQENDRLITIRLPETEVIQVEDE